MQNNQQTLNERETHSKLFDKFKNLQQKQIYGILSDITFNEVDVQIDSIHENILGNESLISSIETQLSAVVPVNDKVKIVFHDFPMQIEDSQALLRSYIFLNEYSLSLILNNVNRIQKQNCQLPEFLLQKNDTIFEKKTLEENNLIIDSLGINFQFDIGGGKATHLLMRVENTILEISFQGEPQRIDQLFLNHSGMDEQFLSINIPFGTRYIQFKIMDYTSIKYLGFWRSTYHKLRFDQDIYNNLHLLFPTNSQNTEVMSKAFNIDTSLVQDNRIPQVTYHKSSQQTDEGNNQLQGIMNDQCDDIPDTAFIALVHPQMMAGMEKDSKLCMLVSKRTAINVKHVKLADFHDKDFDQRIKNPIKDQFGEDVIDDQCIYMHKLIKFMNEERNMKSDFLVELKFEGITMKYIFDLHIREIYNVQFFKIKQNYIDNLIHSDQEYIDYYSLQLLKFYEPVTLIRQPDLNLWFVDGESKQVLTNNQQLLNYYKDEVRSKVIMQEFAPQVVRNFNSFAEMIKNPKTQPFYSTLQVDYQEALSLVEEIFMAEQGSVGQSSIEIVKAKKYIYISDPNQRYVRLLGFVFLYFLRTIALEIKSNKDVLNYQFRNDEKYHRPLELNFKQIDNLEIQEMLETLPMQHIQTLFHFCSFTMDRKIDWIFSLKYYTEDAIFMDFELQVNIDKGYALVNSPSNELFPIPAIMQFKDQLEHELTQDDLEDLTEATRSRIEQYLSSYIDFSTGDLRTKQLNIKYKNDIIQNTYFNLFLQNQEMKNQVINFIKDVQVNNKYSFELNGYRIYSVSRNLQVKNDLLLVRYTNQRLNFEVSRDYFFQQYEPVRKWNGIQFNEELLINYRAESKKETNVKSICTVYLKVVNRSVDIADQLHGIYKNQEDPEIYQFELVRDTIDQMYEKILVVPQVIQLFLYSLLVFVWLDIVFKQLSIVDPNTIQTATADWWGQYSMDMIVQLTMGSKIIFQTEIVLAIKTVLEMMLCNLLTNYENRFITQLAKVFDIFIIKTIFSEKLISYLKFATVIQCSYSITYNLDGNTVPDSRTSSILIVSCFVSMCNMINFLGYFKSTEKLVIILNEILKDLIWTLFLIFTLILSMTCALQGIETLKHQLIDETFLLNFTTTLAASKSWYQPQTLKTFSFWQMFQQSVNLALLGDQAIFEEYNQLIDLLPEFLSPTGDDLTLQNGITSLNTFKPITQSIMIVTIVAQVVILLNFVIAIMADTYSKISDNQLMFSYQLKTSHMIHWHWFMAIQLYIVLGINDRFFKPWKICLLDPGNSSDVENWSGQVDVVKKQIDEKLKRVGGSVGHIGRKCVSLDKKIQEVQGGLEEFKQDIIQGVMGAIRSKKK